MKASIRTPGILMVLVGIAMIALAAAASSRVRKANVARGDYVVNSVALCADCHTPRSRDGQLDAGILFGGAMIGMRPLMEMPAWKDMSPNLTPGGFLREWSDKQLDTFLMTGQDAKREIANPPMPPYRLDKGDAKTVTAYLRSLKPVATQ
jgi:hypothetical protein